MEIINANERPQKVYTTFFKFLFQAEGGGGGGGEAEGGREDAKAEAAQGGLEIWCVRARSVSQSF